MEPRPKRRGISLVQRRQPDNSLSSSQCTATKQPLPSSPLTRVQYQRYPTSNAPSRHASLPKPKVTFQYALPAQTNEKPVMVTPHQSRLISPTPRNILHHSAQPAPPPVQVPPLPPKVVVSAPPPPPPAVTDRTEVDRYSFSTTDIREIDTPRDSQLDYNPLHTHYHNFAHCKEEISKRLFGQSQTQHIERYRPSRVNRWAEEAPKPLQVEQKPTTQVEVQPRKELEVVKEVISLKQEGESRVLGQKATNVAVQVRPDEKKKPRNPAKLKEMERRLMDIIKICDQNLA